VGKPNRQRGTDLCVRGVAPLWSGGPDVFETQSGSENTHGPCAKDVDDADHPNDQRQRGKHQKKLEEYHSGYSDSFAAIVSRDDCF